MEVKVLANHKNGLVHNYLIRPVVNFFRDNLGILLGLLGLCVALSFLSPYFFTIENILNVLRQVSTNANLALGMTLVIIIGGIDLSVGPILALGGTLAAGLITNNNIPVPLAITMGVAVGALLGMFNGVIISRTGIAPFIVTLAMMQIARGAVYVYAAGQPIRTMVPEFNFLGNGYVGPIALPIIYTVVLIILVSILLNKTKMGRYIYAIGGNREAAKYSGINIQRVQVLVHTLIGAIAAFSGVILCARMYSGQPTLGNGFELDAIAAVVLGGTSFSGGVGRIGGTIIGVLVIGVLNNGLNLLNINSFWQLIVKGFVILLAVYIDISKKKKRLKQ